MVILDLVAMMVPPVLDDSADLGVESDDALPFLPVLERSSSLRAMAKIDGTYSWVYNWVERLEEIGIVERSDGIRNIAPDVREGFARLMEAIGRRPPSTVDEAYVLPHFAEMEFAYTKIDAVYVWTHGGYQVARGGDAYPVFVRVDEGDVDAWRSFFDRDEI